MLRHYKIVVIFNDIYPKQHYEMRIFARLLYCMASFPVKGWLNPKVFLAKKPNGNHPWKWQLLRPSRFGRVRKQTNTQTHWDPIALEDRWNKRFTLTLKKSKFWNTFRMWQTMNLNPHHRRHCILHYMGKQYRNGANMFNISANIILCIFHNVNILSFMYMYIFYIYILCFDLHTCILKTSGFAFKKNVSDMG